mmetsp:Transcript_32952/g.76991  ORF Transcript_32952/g.76991 Transcript_32952/m.76991 type:complete len:599 (-) Transcript_32952:562-2358(-)
MKTRSGGVSKKPACSAGTSKRQLAASLVREIEFDGATLECFRNICATSEIPFADSELYSPATDQKFLDKSKRVSEFRLHKSEEIFELSEAVARSISESDERYNYRVVRNDVSEIRYKAGGFFHEHEDFLSSRSNVITEYTLLLCVTPEEGAGECRGGETVVRGNGTRMKSTATTIPGKGLVFRKDLKHQGLQVGKGEKHILSVNLWATRKASTTQILLVTFNQSAGVAAGSAKTDTLAGIADGNWYALNVGDCTGFLATHAAWTNRQADERGDPRPDIVVYNCLDFDSVAFGTVFRVMIGCYVTAAELIEHSAALDFFTPSNIQDVLVELDIDSPVLEPSTNKSLKCENCGKAGAMRCKRCRKGAYCSVECYQHLFPQHKDGCDAKHAQVIAASAAAGGAMEASEDRGDVIVCDSAERTAVVAAVANTLGLDWVRFKMVFVEGTAEHRIEIDYRGDHIPMIAAWIYVGDYDNILLSRGIFHFCSCAKPMTMEEISKTDYYRMLPIAQREKLGTDEDGFRCSEEFDYSELLDDDWYRKRPNEGRSDESCFYYGLELAEGGQGGQLPENSLLKGPLPKELERASCKLSLGTIVPNRTSRA